MSPEKTEFEQQMSGWFAGRIPSDWFTGAAEVSSDREEVLVVGRLADVEVGDDATPAERAAAQASRIEAFREDTRAQRMRIASEAQHRFGRKVSWGVETGEGRKLFTTLSMPVMTRLRMRERSVLDTLVDAGVARSRSEALAWCVRLVADNQGEWIDSLRSALEGVESIRREGPKPS